ncbi:MAG: hypothetical protein H8E44_03735 [Planctomycetes bacterium]|nr:hypothetical protein [Planctomycetota bacterium]
MRIDSVRPRRIIWCLAICGLGALLLTGCGEQAVVSLSLDDLAPNAAGVCLAEIADLQEIDERPGDGNLFVRAKLRVIRGSGAIPERIDIVKEYGGLGPPGPMPKPYGPLRPDSLTKGHRYWFAFCSKYEVVRSGTPYPQGVIRCWPEKQADVAVTLEQAVCTDHYAWHPQYHPVMGLTHGYREEPEKNRWQIRVSRDGAVLWEKTLAGERADRYSSLGFIHQEDWPSYLQYSQSDTFLLAETATTLEDDNDYDLPAAKYYVLNIFDATTGKRAAVRVSLCEEGMVERVFRVLDTEAGGLIR